MHEQVVSLRSVRPVGRSRPAGFFLLGLMAGALALAPAAAQPVGAGLGAATSATLAPRGAAPGWFVDGQSPAAEKFLHLLATSDAEGIAARQFDLRALQRAVDRAARDPKRAAAANRMLDEAFVRYVDELRALAPSSEWTVVDRGAIVPPPPPLAMLHAAAAGGSLERFIETMPWMHEHYAGLRRALVAARERGDSARVATLRLNLDRVRLLPATGPQRYVMVNAPAQRLYLYENGKIVDSMKVVVGKPTQPTPVMAALIRYTAVNPYWNLPDDLVAERIAPHVVEQGLPYLKRQGYVVLSDWTDQARRVDPATIDWKDVLAGKTEIRMRQDPGPFNAMGRMKFVFPNPAGVYLHDTPDRKLLEEPARLASAGCVRLEDAPRLARWLYGRPLVVTKGMKPEQRVDLDSPVPVYLAYLTAVPDGEQIVDYDDIYGRDRALLGDARLAARPLPNPG
jgi:murein L,D-transpeptidase YcbB/YkuD